METAEENNALIATDEMATEENNALVNTEELNAEENNALITTDEMTTEENNALVNTEELTTEEYTNNALALATPETQPTKRRKKKSMVWEYFSIETVGPGCRRASCNRCKQSFAYSTGSKVAGTSHLKRHIAKGTCTVLERDQDNNQPTPFTPRNGGSLPIKRRYRSPASSAYVPFDQDRCRHELVKMMIMHDYPLHMVEHPGFMAFVESLHPRFDKVSFNTIQGDCVATYLREKQNVSKSFEKVTGRFCVTLDMWMANQTLGYVFITGHYIDCDWKLHRRILNVIMEPYPDSSTALSHAVAACLSDWNLEGRLFSITFNHPLGDAGKDNLRSLICTKDNTILNGQLLIGNCVARTLGSMAKDVLAAGKETIMKIRNCVKHVKTSEPDEEKFLEIKQQLLVRSDKSLSLDNQNQWNTTYQMLVAAFELKEVFSCLDSTEVAPSAEDWRQVELLCNILKPIFEAVNILATATNPTAITLFHEVWKIHSDLARSINSDDPFIRNLSKVLQEKIDKYWKDCSLVLAMAVVMDPRFKMKLVEFSFTKIYSEEAPALIKIVDDGIHDLFLEYVALPLPLTPTYAEEGNAGTNSKTDDSHGDNLPTDNGLTDFDAYIIETTSQQMKSELDQYLEESLLPRVQEFDVLGWWKQNKLKYPTLSKMARDILSIPVCAAAPDSVFDLVNKQLDEYRTSLRPETVEALICAKDWLRYGSADVSNAAIKMEF